MFLLEPGNGWRGWFGEAFHFVKVLAYPFSFYEFAGKIKPDNERGVVRKVTGMIDNDSIRENKHNHDSELLESEWPSSFSALILQRFRAFLFPSMAQIEWRHDEDGIHHVLVNHDHQALGTVKILPRLFCEENPNGETKELMCFVVSKSDSVPMSDRKRFKSEVKALIQRTSALERRLPYLFSAFFPRRSDGRIDWEKCAMEKAFCKGRKPENSGIEKENNDRFLPWSKDKTQHSRTPWPWEHLPERRMELSQAGCGLDCIFCSCAAIGTKRTDDLQRMEDAYRFIQDASWPSEPDQALCVRGNQPLQHPDFLSLLELLGKRGWQNIVLESSEYERMDAIMLEELSSLNVKMIRSPIYGTTASTHDLVVGRQGHFEAMRRTLESSQRLPLIFMLHSVALLQNINELESIPALAENMNAEFLHFIYPRPVQQSRLSYDRIAPKLTDIPLPVRGLLDLRIPCVSAGTDTKETHYRDNPKRLTFGKNCPQCKGYTVCDGIYREYLDLYGEEELVPM